MALSLAHAVLSLEQHAAAGTDLQHEASRGIDLWRLGDLFELTSSALTVCSMSDVRNLTAEPKSQGQVSNAKSGHTWSQGARAYVRAG